MKNLFVMVRTTGNSNRLSLCGEPFRITMAWKFRDKQNNETNSSVSINTCFILL